MVHTAGETTVNMNCVHPAASSIRPGTRPCWAFGLLTVLLVVCGSTGCQVTTETEGAPLPVRRDAPQNPSGIQATRMLFAVESKPADTNGNGYPDTIHATVMLFRPPHPTPFWEAGRFVFALYPHRQVHQPGVEPIAEWIVEPDVVRESRAFTDIGETYQFRLSLLEHRSDRMPLMSADFICRFEPLDGRTPVHSSGVRTVQLGR